jgi:DNA segregation ATPase FtsK/SpoIIIE-like protein
LGSIAGGILGVLLSFGVATGAVWLALGAPLPRKSKNQDQGSPVAAALREVDVDGVSAAEAEALFPDPGPAVQPAPGVLDYQRRARGELPEGVQVLGSKDDDEDQQPQDHRAPAPVARRASPGAGLAQPASADLAETGPARPLRQPEGVAAGGLQDGVWVRPVEASELTTTPGSPPVETEGVRPIEGGTPLRPSWERSEDPAAMAEDGERFAEFEVEEPVQVEVPEPGAEFLAPVEEELAEEPSPDADGADGADGTEQPLVEVEAVEPAAAVVDDLELDAAPELETEVALDPLGVFEAEVIEEDADDELVEEPEAGPVRPSWEQPGLFDSTEEDDLEAAAELEDEEEELEDEEAEEDDLEAAAELEDEEEELEDVELQPAARVQPEPEPEPEPEAEPTVELTHEELVYRSGCLFLEEGRVAVSMLQRRFELSFKEATIVLDELQSMGLIGPYLGGNHRDILLTSDEWEALAAAV